MLAVVIIAVIGKLFAYDYLRTGWANIFYGNEQVQEQAIITPPVVETETSAQEPATQSDATQPDATQPNATHPAQPEPTQPSQPSDAQQLLENIKLNLEKITPEQLNDAGFKNAKTVRVNFDNRIFQMIDTSDISNADMGQFNISDEKNIYAVITEVQTHTDLEAQDLYSLIKKRIQGMTGITINENSQFGDAAFFMNDPKRLGNAFLVVRSKNHAYYFTYPKTNHEFIKKLIILLNQ